MLSDHGMCNSLLPIVPIQLCTFSNAVQCSVLYTSFKFWSVGSGFKAVLIYTVVHGFYISGFVYQLRCVANTIRYQYRTSPVYNFSNSCELPLKWLGYSATLIFPVLGGVDNSCFGCQVWCMASVIRCHWQGSTMLCFLAISTYALIIFR